MKLTSKGRYAVMALADLAKFNSTNPVSLRDISLRQGISLDFLEQIFSKLKRYGIVKSIRGINGGYILKKGCNGKTTKCITHNLWDELQNHINDFFEHKNLRDLIVNNPENRI